MNRPKTTIGMDFDPLKWLPDKGTEKFRPAVEKISVQPPLLPGGSVPFTAFYWADDRMYRVEGESATLDGLVDAVALALESHWWKYNPLDDDLDLPF